MSPLFSTARWTARTLRSTAVPRTLLIVDDDPEVAEAIFMFLLQTGDYNPQFVLSGRDALAAVTARVPEIALVDIDMPEMDGFAVAGLLRHDVRTQHTVIVAFTARDECEIRAHAVVAGFDAYCRKGQTPESVLDLLRHLAR